MANIISVDFQTLYCDNQRPVDVTIRLHSPRVRELYQRPFFEQGTIEWLQQREDFLTASDVGAVLGNSFFKDRKTLLGIKVGRKMHWVHEGEFMEI